jgi:hypothetical protein
MRKRLTPEEKKQYALKQTLTAKEVNRLETNPDARRISHSEMEALLEASRVKTPA